MPSGLPGFSNDAIAARNFAVEIDGLQVMQCQEVGGITSEIDVTELKENTKDGKLVIKKLPGAPKPPTLTLKRAKNISLDLWKWHDDIAKGRLNAARKNGSIIAYDFEGKEALRYNFINAWPSKIEMSSPKAGANELLIETCTFVCEALERVK